MTIQKIALAALAGTALLAAAPAFADNYRGDRYGYRGEHFQRRVVVAHQQAPYYAQRRVVVHRPVVVQPPVVVYRPHSSHEILGGLLLGAVIGAAIANHAGY